MQIWKLHEAERAFSDLIHYAQQEPIMIMVDDEEVAVIISKDAFQKLSNPTLSLGAFLDQSPLKGLALPLERDNS